MTFTDLHLHRTILHAVEEEGYTTPTPIQQQAIPVILEEHDLVACAQTGTGKTAAYSLPIIQQLHDSGLQKNQHGIKVLVLAPTRELAIQISDNIKAYQQFLHVKSVVLYGGVSMNNQINSLKQSPQIVIATPGRLIDLMKQGYIKLNQIKTLVLDEADRMLDMGFIHDIKFIIKHLPQERQNLMFSATAEDSIMKIANQILKNPKHVAVNPVSSSSALVKQEVYHVSKEQKRSLLKYLIEQNQIEHGIVFTRTKRGADNIAKDLKKIGIKSEAIHGNKSQNNREKTLKAFKEKSLTILVATDIAARGLDIDKLSHVINFEIPEVAETYVHRIGRTGRAGNPGVAFSLCTKEEMTYMKNINYLLKKNVDVIKSHPYHLS